MRLYTQDKRDLRSFMRKTRRDLVQNTPEVAMQSALKMHAYLSEYLDENFEPADLTVSAYWPIGSEVDLRTLLTTLSNNGSQVLLPKSCSMSIDMQFVPWKPGAEMEESDLGFQYPKVLDAGFKAQIPSIVIVPLIAFDRRGYRLGYGKGFYDRALQELYAIRPNLLTIGVGFSIQEVDNLPIEPHDVRLNMVVTEQGIRKF